MNPTTKRKAKKLSLIASLAVVAIIASTFTLACSNKDDLNSPNAALIKEYEKQILKLEKAAKKKLNPLDFEGAFDVILILAEIKNIEEQIDEKEDTLTTKEKKKIEKLQSRFLKTGEKWKNLYSEASE